MINLKGLRAQAKAMGIKYYYRMTKSGLECAIMRHFSSGAVFVPNENNDNSDANFLGTFSFSYFNDKGERTSTTFKLTKKYTRSVVIPEKIITENHYAYFGESFIEFCNSQNLPVAVYYPYLDTIQFCTEWTMHYRQLGSAVNEFSFEYSLRSVLNDILKSAGYLDDNGNFIHDAYGAFRIHAWNFFMQDRQHNELKDFIMPDVVFSGYEDRDNPITWVKDSPQRNDALTAYIRLLYTEDNAKIIKKYCPHDEGILDSFILNLRDSIQRMHHSYSDLDEIDALSYDEAINALCDTALNMMSIQTHYSIAYFSGIILLSMMILLKYSKNAQIVHYERLHSTILHLFMSVRALEEGITFQQEKLKFSASLKISELSPLGFSLNESARIQS